MIIQKHEKVLEQDIIAIIPDQNGKRGTGLVKTGNKTININIFGKKQMYTNKNFGFDDSLLNAVRGVVAKNRYMTKTQVETNIDNGLWQAETELVEGKIAYIYENTTRTRNKIVIVAEAKVKDENIGRFQETFIKMALTQSKSLIKDYREGLGTTKNDDDKDFKKAAKEVAEKANAKVNVKFFGGLGREMTPAEFKKKLEAEVRYSGRSLKGGYFTRYLTSYFKYLIREYNSYIT
jgi:hypothetical protein